MRAAWYGGLNATPTPTEGLRFVHTMIVFSSFIVQLRAMARFLDGMEKEAKPPAMHGPNMNMTSYTKAFC